MSYDLYMLGPQSGEDPIHTLERLAEQEESASPDPAVAARNSRIADTLLALNPAYTRSAISHEVIANQTGVTVEEARPRHRYIELEDESGMQITLFDEQASISFPYWDSLDPAQLAQQIEQAATVIAKETGWQLYDPQLERFLDPVRDADEFAEAFGVGVGRVRHISAEHEAGYSGAKRPSWWRRLFGRE